MPAFVSLGHIEVEEVYVPHRVLGHKLVGFVVVDGSYPPEARQARGPDGDMFYRMPHEIGCSDPDCPFPRGSAEVWVHEDVYRVVQEQREEDRS